MCAKFVIVVMVIGVSWASPPGPFCTNDADCTVDGKRCVQVNPAVKRCVDCLCLLGEQCELGGTNGNGKTGASNNNANGEAYVCNCNDVTEVQPICEPTCAHSPPPCGLNTDCSDANGTVAATCTCLAGYVRLPGEEDCSVDISCDFSDCLCGWTQSNEDVFDWRRRVGSTPSVNTGPDGDNTGDCGGGFYLYTEATIQNASDTAVLLSPTMAAGQTYCFKVATNMYGASMGTIDIGVKDTSSAALTVIQTFSTATPSPVWLSQSVDIQAQPNSFMFFIRGTIGYNATLNRTWQSDLAIDDLWVSNGNC